MLYTVLHDETQASVIASYHDANFYVISTAGCRYKIGIMAT